MSIIIIALTWLCLFIIVILIGFILKTVWDIQDNKFYEEVHKYIDTETYNGLINISLNENNTLVSSNEINRDNNKINDCDNVVNNLH